MHYPKLSKSKMGAFLLTLFVGGLALIVSQLISMLHCLKGIVQEKVAKEGGSASVSIKNGQLEVISSKGSETVSFYDLLLSGSGMAIGAIVGILLILITVGIWQRKNSLRFLGFSTPQKKHWISTIGVLIVCLSLSYILSLFFTPDYDYARKTIASADNHFLLVIQIGILVPILEELIFRGLIFRGAERISQSTVFPILFSTVLFTVSHAQYGFSELLNVAIFGLSFGYLRNKTGSIWPSITVHASINTLAMILAIIEYRQ